MKDLELIKDLVRAQERAILAEREMMEAKLGLGQAVDRLERARRESVASVREQFELGHMS